MKNKILPVLAVLAAIFSGAFLAWLFRLHGTRGLLHVEIIGWFAVIFIALAGLLPLALWFVYFLRGKKARLLRAAVILVSISSLAVPVSGFAYINGFPSPTFTATAPRLIISGTGAYGLPDIAVTFMSSKPTASTLTWGRDELSHTIVEPAAVTTHVFILKDLRPDSRYWFRLNGRIDDGPIYYFSTPGPQQPLHFAVGSDAHFGAGDSRPDITAQMLDMIAGANGDYDYFFFLGDLVEFGFRPAEWQQALAALPAASATIPTAFAPGNHDTLFTGLGRYLDYCCPAGVAFGSGSRLWRRIDAGDIHFLILDLEWSAEAFTPAQQAWLEAELQSIPAEDWTVVLNHGFYYGSGSVTRGWAWWDNQETIGLITPLFEKYDVDLVFSGHAHQMELLEHNGVTYVIAGAFGGIPDPEREYISPASLWYASGQYGFVDVAIAADQAAIAFTLPDGQVLHTASVAR
jgi:acid phosphatase type 7